MINRIPGLPLSSDLSSRLPPQVAEQLDQLQHLDREQVEALAGEWARTLRGYIILRPAVSLGIAVSVGVLIGWFLKRR